MASGHAYNETGGGAPFARGNRLFCDVGVQTDEHSFAQASKHARALRNRRNYLERKAKELQAMHAQLALGQAQKELKQQQQQQQPSFEEAIALVEPICPANVPLVKIVECSSAACDGLMAVRLVHAVGCYQVKQLRPLSELELLMDTTLIAQQINGLCIDTRLRAARSSSQCPSSYVPEYTTSLADNNQKESLMTEEIWAGSPSLFSEPFPLGPYFTIDPTHRGVQHFSFTFPDTKVCITWCAVFVPPDQQSSIVQLHNQAALLLAKGSLGAPDNTATESKYLPVGWATMECGSSKVRLYGVPFSDIQSKATKQIKKGRKQSNPKASTGVNKKYRLPYARAQAHSLLPL
eukprot:6203783-Pleurochrysis_carterae.AAC.1